MRLVLLFTLLFSFSALASDYEKLAAQVFMNDLQVQAEQAALESMGCFSGEEDNMGPNPTVKLLMVNEGHRGALRYLYVVSQRWQYSGDDLMESGYDGLALSAIVTLYVGESAPRRWEHSGSEVKLIR